VLAKAVNCLDLQDGEPCNRCAICRSLNEGRSLDLIEIDGASNTGVDDVRGLREKIAFSPSECRYKVYVIDEVHMLSNAAFNALLKTLEEPPPHAIFVLATTEPHKIPLTVLSRCQRFDFRRISLPHLRQKLERISEQEGIHVEPAAVDAIARHASGSFRDAESLLDQLVSYGTETISVEDVRRVLGSPSEEVVSGIVGAIGCRDVRQGLRLINDALDHGVRPRQLTGEILEYLRWLLLAKSGGESLLSVTPETLKEVTAQAQGFPLKCLLHTIGLFNQATNHLRSGIHVQLPLELAFVEAALFGEQAAPSGEAPGLGREPQATSRVPRSPGLDEEGGAGVVPAVTEGSSTSLRTESEEAPEPAELPPDVDSQTDSSPPVEGEMTETWLEQNWDSLLNAIRPRSRSVEALLKSCEPISVQGDLVTLGFYHAFHKERMDEDRNRRVVEEALAEVGGQDYRVRCVMYKGDRKQEESGTEEERRAKLLDNPVVREAISRYGAKVVDIK
jgi:DNA polymerase-3 subunit gamma/tau